MDNRELAEVLLSEATDLLNESTRQKREEFNKGEQNSLYWGNVAARAENIRKKLNDEAFRLKYKEHDEKWNNFKAKKDLHNASEKARKKSEDYDGRKCDAMYNGIIANSGTVYKNQSSNDKLTYGQRELHRKINEKVNNDCVDLAALLTEAALLLNDED